MVKYLVVIRIEETEGQTDMLRRAFTRIIRDEFVKGEVITVGEEEKLKGLRL